jgi:hypothetical protein
MSASRPPGRGFHRLPLDGAGGEQKGDTQREQRVRHGSEPHLRRSRGRLARAAPYASRYEVVLEILQMVPVNGIWTSGASAGFLNLEAGSLWPKSRTAPKSTR